MRKAGCHVASSLPPNAGVVPPTSAADESVRHPAPKAGGDFDGAPATPAVIHHRQDHSYFQMGTELGETARRLGDGSDRSRRIRISKASRRRPRVSARWRSRFGDHLGGSSTDRSTHPKLLAFAPDARAPALRYQSIAVTKRAPGLPNRIPPKLRSLHRNARYFLASSPFRSTLLSASGLRLSKGLIDVVLWSSDSF